MLFNSYIFVLLFLPIVLLVYFGLGTHHRYRAAKVFLVAASLVFYAYNNLSYFLIIVVSLLVNYAASIGMSRGQTMVLKRVWLFVALGTDFGLLFYFKYFDFFLENFNAVFACDLPLLTLALPLGISFYTFQQVGYVVDVYQGRAGAYDFWDYALFVTFFPQLIAGPIALHSEMVPQFQDEKNYCPNEEHLAEGIYDFAVGLAKKVLLADTLGKAVNAGFADVAALSTVEAWLVMLAYTLQIYFDFSGYCDMASGISSMFNFRLPQNFNSPYRSRSIPEFWNRWHITLGRFLKEYLYFPLGGSRRGSVYVNLLIVFLASGLWHGADWSFVLWGLYHGVLSCLHRLWHKGYDRLPQAIQVVLTFFAVNLGWVLFRAQSIGEAACFFGRMFTWNGAQIGSDISVAFHIPGMNRLLHLLLPFSFGSETTFALEMFLWLLAALVLVYAAKNLTEQRGKLRVSRALLAVGCLVVSVLSFQQVTTFLYFNF